MRALPAATLAAAVLTAGTTQADLLHQDIAVDLTDPDTVRIDLEATVEFTTETNAFDFILPSLPVASAEVDGTPATVTPHPQYPTQLLRITFPAPLPADQTAVLRLTLEGMLTCTDAYCGRTPSETYFTYGVPGAAWYLADPFVSDAFTGTVSIDVPDGVVAVSGVGGAEVAAIVDGQRWAYAWDHPLELIGLYAGRPATLTSSDGRVTAYYDPMHEDENLVQQGVDVASGVLPVYEELYGPLPVDRIGLTALPSNVPFGALGMLANVYFNGIVFTGDGYLVRQGVAHEVAHSWWGNLADGDGAGRGFFGEAFAEFAAWRALGVLDGEEQRTSGMRMNAVWYQYRRPGGDDASIQSVVQGSPLYVFVTYHKGALALRALESEVGADAYDTAMRRFLARGPGGLTFEGLEEDFGAASNVDFGRWKSQWVDRPGYPRIQVAARRSDESISLDVDVLDDYVLQLPVVLVSGDGSREELKYTVEPGLRTIDIERAGVVAVEVDPRWTMAREVRSTNPSDVTLDGRVDGADLIEVALRQGSYLPTTRRVDGRYDPLYDVVRDELVDANDLEAVRAAASQ